MRRSVGDAVLIDGHPAAGEALLEHPVQCPFGEDRPAGRFNKRGPEVVPRHRLTIEVCQDVVDVMGRAATCGDVWVCGRCRGRVCDPLGAVRIVKV